MLLIAEGLEDPLHPVSELHSQFNLRLSFKEIARVTRHYVLERHGRSRSIPFTQAGI
jgi:hypothetical protein